MASTPVRLTLDRGEITVEDLSAAIGAFGEYLLQLDQLQSPSGRRTLVFRVVSLSYHSPALVTAVAEPREDTFDNGPAVVTLAIRGIREIEAGAGRPRGFSDEALESLRKLAGYSTNGAAAVTIDAPTLNLSASVTNVLALQVERVLSQGESIGAIEGQLDTISVHGRPFFTLYDALSGKGVRCYFPERYRERAVGLLGRKVVAHGRLRRDPSGQPREMSDLDHLEPLGETPSSVVSLAGILRGVDARQHLREVRGE